MSVEILRYPGEAEWKEVYSLALATMGKVVEDKAPDIYWKIKLLDSGHSPARSLVFKIRMIVPYYVSTHFVRHKIGVEHWVQSQRNDRQKNYDRNEAPQSAPVMHTMLVDAEALIRMAHQRLCGKADPATQAVMREIVSEVNKLCPEFEPVLVPMCIYRGNKCHEMKPCGRML